MYANCFFNSFKLIDSTKTKSYFWAVRKATTDIGNQNLCLNLDNYYLFSIMIAYDKAYWH